MAAGLQLCNHEEAPLVYTTMKSMQHKHSESHHPFPVDLSVQ